MTPEERKEKVAELRKHHEDTFAALGIPKSYFCAKHAHVPAGWDSKAVGLYPSELSQGDDVYLEFVSMDYVPADSTRRLYVLKYNPKYISECEVKREQHMIPVEEFQVVQVPMEPNPFGQLYQGMSAELKATTGRKWRSFPGDKGEESFNQRANDILTGKLPYPSNMDLATSVPFPENTDFVLTETTHHTYKEEKYTDSVGRVHVIDFIDDSPMKYTIKGGGKPLVIDKDELEIMIKIIKQLK